MQAVSPGLIELIVGPMFAGKSTELMRRMKRLSIAGKRCLYVNHDSNTRYGTGITTHDGKEQEALNCSTLSNLSIHQYDVVGIDEGQFFPDLVEFCEAAANDGKIVIVAALNGTFERKPFHQIIELFSRVEHITKLEAVCMYCQADASFSKRLNEDRSIHLVGGTDLYAAVCRVCYSK